jgi:hypothetical protein
MLRSFALFGLGCTALALGGLLGCSAGKAPGLGGNEGGSTSGSGSTSNNGGSTATGGTHTGGGNAGGGGNTPNGGTGAGTSGGTGGGSSGSGTSGSTSGGNGGDAGATVKPPPDALADPLACTSNAPGPRKLWRLSASEYAASIHGIFNDTSGGAPVGSIFSDPIILGFQVDASTLVVQGLNASQLMDNAEAVAAWAAQNNQLSQFASCTTVDKTCAQKFVQGFGRRAFRTTLAVDDPRVASYTALFTAEKTFTDAAQSVMTAMLQSPYFLYRSELGKGSGDAYSLSPYEVATELSYLLTSGTPDDTLLAAADSVAAGSLPMTSMIDQQAARLLASGSTNAVMGFVNGWLGLDRLYTTAKDDTVFMLTKSLRDAMATEAQKLVVEAFDANGTIGSLLTADHTFLNKDLANLYGLDASGLGTDFKSVPLPADGKRASGLLATGAILNGYARPDTSSPTQRGHMVRSRMLCQGVDPPGKDLDTTFKPSTKVETTRDHFANEHGVGPCAGCHQLMDWTGFAFEHYDGFGRYRDTENGLPIDDSAIVYAAPEGNNVNVAGLSGPGSLGEYLSESDDVQKCMLRYWTYFAYGTSSWAQDACTYDAVYAEAANNNFALKSVLMAILHAPNFVSRVKDQ